MPSNQVFPYWVRASHQPFLILQVDEDTQTTWVSNTLLVEMRQFHREYSLCDPSYFLVRGVL